MERQLDVFSLFAWLRNMHQWPLFNIQYYQLEANMSLKISSNTISLLVDVSRADNGVHLVYQYLCHETSSEHHNSAIASYRL